MGKRLSSDDFVSTVAERVASRVGGGDAGGGGGRLNLRGGGGGSERPNRLQGAMGGGRKGPPRGVGVSRGLRHPLAERTSIYDRINPEEAEGILRWWQGVAADRDDVAERAVAELRQERSHSLLGTRAPGDPQQISSDVLGGHLAPTQFVDEVIIALGEETPFANGEIINLFPMGQDAVSIPKITKKPDAGGPVAEGSAYTKTNAEIGTVQLFARKHGVIIPITEEMLMGSSIDMVAMLAQLVAEQLAEQRNEFVTNGNGTDEPEGVRSNGNIATVTFVDTDDQTRADSIIKTFYAVPQRYRRNAVWLMPNGAIEKIRKLKTTDGEYLWTDGFADAPATIMGRPVFENPDIPTDLGGGTDTELLFGDFRRGYTLGTREGVTMQQDSSGADWEKDIVNLKWRERLDGKVTDENAFVRTTGVDLST